MLSALSGLESCHQDLPGLPIAASYVRRQLKASPSLAPIPPAEVRLAAMRAIMRASFALCGSGEYHTYRGHLSVAGRSLWDVHSWACDQLVTAGWFGTDDAAHEKATLAEDIASAG